MDGEIQRKVTMENKDDVERIHLADDGDVNKYQDKHVPLKVGVLEIPGIATRGRGTMSFNLFRALVQLSAAHQKKVQRGGQQRERLQDHHKKWEKRPTKTIKKVSKKPDMKHVIDKRMVRGKWEYNAVYADLSTEWLSEKQLIKICPLWMALQVRTPERSIRGQRNHLICLTLLCSIMMVSR